MPERDLRTPACLAVRPRASPCVPVGTDTRLRAGTRASGASEGDMCILEILEIANEADGTEAEEVTTTGTRPDRREGRAHTYARFFESAG